MTFERDEELEQLSAQLVEARAQAEEASAMKRAFLHNMSHELRTPLNAIIGYSDMLLEEAEDLGGDGEIFVTDLEKIRSSGRNLLVLVNDVLDMSKIESGDNQLYYEEVNVSELLPEVAHALHEHLEHGGNRLTIDLDPALPHLFTDRTKVRQTLLELLRNASKFTHDGDVFVAVNATDEGPEALVSITVRDNGEGIAESELEHIFYPFRQVDGSATREHDGAGLGLALCRDFCRSLRGELSVKSRLGEGSEFTVTLPVVSPATRMEAISSMDVLDLWAGVESEVNAATSLEQAAQALATAIHTRLSESTALTRVFVTVDQASLPDDVRGFVQALADRSDMTGELNDSTPVLSLIGTYGVHPHWVDRRRSEDHLGIPLISADFVDDIPMISSLLKDLGLPLDWMERSNSSVIQRTIGQSAGLFFVENASSATDERGRKIIPAQDFVMDHGVGSVFGLSGAYSGDEILVVITFCTEQFPKAVAERFLPLLTLFKSATAVSVLEGRIFDANDTTSHADRRNER
jgi:nitrogen-specific signal transduction histidine kinase